MDAIRSKSRSAFEPEGTEFTSNGKQMMLVEMPESPVDGWIVYRHPDGQWVTLRKATADDYTRLAAEARRMMMIAGGDHWRRKAKEFLQLAAQCPN